MPTLEVYTLPRVLLQAIVECLNDAPSRISRLLLNSVEAECLRQDKAHAALDAQAQRDALREELTAAALMAQGSAPTAPATKTP